MVRIDNQTNISELLSFYPETGKVFRKFGVPVNG